ncbi:50S ribosomal protein L25 [Tuanshanicoccus lijuaniae]|uniref:50S ribosomal protein L25 n=1 Tax=Aerococcaceae bacterium zg-1292 TaxID=2774330 RepID=UPI001BD803B8|nr:50S ribosomal protein L25 [Aerococcaceae bacterium zg-A91]MBS4457924.1 50S ribosomal protein L25 [Aerococcaceae bacterium zg-BR33]
MKLQAELRTKTGTSASRLARREGKIPATLYSKDVEVASLLIDRRDFEALLKKEGQNAILDVEFDGNSQQVLIKNFDRAALKDEFYSIDFQAVSDKEKLQVEVPVVLVNVETIKEGIVDQVSATVLVETTPANIPASIEFDVEGLVIGDVKTVADLTVPEKVTVVTEPETTLVSVAPPAAEEETETSEEEVAEPEVIGEEDAE